MSMSKNVSAFLLLCGLGYGGMYLANPETIVAPKSEPVVTAEVTEEVEKPPTIIKEIDPGPTVTLDDLPKVEPANDLPDTFQPPQPEEPPVAERPALDSELPEAPDPYDFDYENPPFTEIDDSVKPDEPDVVVKEIEEAPPPPLPIPEAPAPEPASKPKRVGSMKPGKSLMHRGVDFRYRSIDGNTQRNQLAAQILGKNPSWTRGVVAVLNNKHKGAEYYASGVCIGYDKTTNTSYVVTAQHVTQYGHTTSVILRINGVYISFDVFDMKHHPKRDFTLLSVDGKLPVVPIYKGYPKSSFDISIGYEGPQFEKLYAREGWAEPGMSGGAVASREHGVFAIVSQKAYGVLIWSSLKNMGLTHLVGEFSSTSKKRTASIILESPVKSNSYIVEQPKAVEVC